MDWVGGSREVVVVNPPVSVVIPAYNQAQYLDKAIESVLAQTYRDFEIIVVDDGSTDGTPIVARRFGSAVRYLRQENRGLAGARNTGIRHARGEYVALLDSDDVWLPAFLETMLSVAAREPEASVYHCRWRHVDPDGQLLPQAPSGIVVPRYSQYRALLKGNFLAPSAALLRRAPVVSAGLFDQRFRRIEDWELWLRLLQQGHCLAGSTECLLLYRVHGASLSTDHDEMYRSVLAVVEKLFGPDDGDRDDWPEEKRLAYGGAHRYGAIASVLRGDDWQRCAGCLREALLVDPKLAIDMDLFYELALGAQPLGYRGTAYYLDLAGNAARLSAVLRGAFHGSASSELARLRSRALGTAYYALGLVAHNTGQFPLSRRFLPRALRFRPYLLRDPHMTSLLAKCLAGRALLEPLRLTSGRRKTKTA